MRKGKFYWNSQKAAFEEDFAIREHGRIVIEAKLIYLFNAVSLTMAVFANYAVFLSLLFVNSFVVNKNIPAVLLGP